MRSLPVVLLIPLAFALTTCSGRQSTPKNETPIVERLVDQLPAGVEGVELAKDGLRLKKGYRFVKDSDTTFAIMRMNDRQVVGYGGCGCWIGVGCIPLDQNGIIVCHQFPGCIECGLAVTPSGGVRTEIFRYTKKG